THWVGRSGCPLSLNGRSPARHQRAAFARRVCSAAGVGVGGWCHQQTRHPPVARLGPTLWRTQLNPEDGGLHFGAGRWQGAGSATTDVWPCECSCVAGPWKGPNLGYGPSVHDDNDESRVKDVKRTRAVGIANAPCARAFCRATEEICPSGDEISLN